MFCARSPLADRSSPHNTLLSAGCVIPGKPDFHHLCLHLQPVESNPLRMANLFTRAESSTHGRRPPLLNTCYRLGGRYYHINAALCPPPPRSGKKGGSYSVALARSLSLSSSTLIPLSLYPTLSFTPHHPLVFFFFLPSRYAFGYFSWLPSTHPHFGLICVRGWHPFHTLELKRPSGEERWNTDGIIGGESKNQRQGFSL